MRKKYSKGKSGKIVKCPKCGYKWKSKQLNKPWVCCSRCKRYFKPVK